MRNRFALTITVGAISLLTLVMAIAPSQALAYAGPGAGLSAIGSLLAILAAVGLGIVGFVWYPLKRFGRMLRGRKDKASE